jgi:internalin A
LASLEKLSALYIANNKITDAAPFAKLTRLSSLDLAGNRIGDLTPISELKGLSLLKLSENDLADLSKLQIGTDLKMLILMKNKLTDLGPLVTQMEADAKGPMRVAPFLRLYLEGNPLSDKAKGEQIPALKKLGVKVFLGEPGEKQ